MEKRWILWWLSGKESTCQSRRHRFDPWVRKIPGEGNGNPVQYSCLENPIDRGTWRATVHGFARVGYNLATKPPPVRTHSKPSGTKVRPFSPGKFINVSPLMSTSSSAIVLSPCMFKPRKPEAAFWMGRRDGYIEEKLSNLFHFRGVVFRSPKLEKEKRHKTFIKLQPFDHYSILDIVITELKLVFF